LEAGADDRNVLDREAAVGEEVDGALRLRVTPVSRDRGLRSGVRLHARGIVFLGTGPGNRGSARAARIREYSAPDKGDNQLNRGQRMSKLQEISARATSSAPPEAVWRLLADVNTWSEWADFDHAEVER